MGNKNRIGKLEKFESVKTFDNVRNFSYEDLINDAPQKGNWAMELFNNNNDIILELACGKGEYSNGLAIKYPDKNFIGIDVKANRIWNGSKNASNNKLNNVGFIRARIDQIEKLFAKNEISEIWIIFPDPQNRSAKHRKRLTSPVFLNKYKNILKEGSKIHLKTDSKLLYDFTLEVIENENHILINSCNDIYNNQDIVNEDFLNIKTFYEGVWLEQNKTIKSITFLLQ